MDNYAIIGNPVSHSKSPIIHAEFAKQTQQEIQYITIEAPLDGFVETVKEFEATGGKGLSVTLPFKQDAFALANVHSKLAKQAGAANTLFFKDNKEIFADNTDGPGLIRDITNNHHYSLKQKNILILGAGGVVKCIVGSLLEQKPARLDIANRTPQKAIDMAKQFKDVGEINGMGLGDIANTPYDFIINATSASVTGEIPTITDSVIGKNTVCYDLFYSKGPTAFLVWANQEGAEACIDGLGMLVEQAALQFNLWRGVYPDTKPVIELLKLYIANH